MRALAQKFLDHVLPGIVKPLQVLWNEIIGFVFLVIAVTVIFSTVRRTAKDPDGFWLLVAGVAFGLVLGAFGLSSFLRARRISRS
jgi:uncharacterized membrane protein